MGSGLRLLEAYLTPSVSVVMATRDNERDIGLSISSILLQSYGDFELIIVNDASVDRTPWILDTFAALDARIRVIHNDRNVGRASSRNRAIRTSQGDLIAIQDADDVALRDRLERQARYLGSHPDVGMLGAWAATIADRTVQPDVVCSPVDDRTLRHRLEMGRMPLVHSTMMFRRAAVISSGLYDGRFLRSQDYLLCRSLIEITVAGCVAECLELYRIDDYFDRRTVKDRYRWAARAVWHGLLFSQRPNVLALANAARLKCLSVLPGRVISHLQAASLKSRSSQVRLSDSQLSEAGRWVAELERFTSCQLKCEAQNAR